MPIQNYNIYTAKGYAGELCDSGPRVAQSYLADGVDILFGVGVQRGSTPDSVIPGCAVGGNLFGIAMREYNHEADLRPSDGTTSYKPTETVSTFRQGYLYVELTGATSVVEGDAMHIDQVTGLFTKDAVAGNIIATINVSADEDLLVTGGTDILRVRMDIVHT